ncbi:MAG: hypothetical protein R3B60_03555 [Candidatus Paceibacterota bacterium]
MTETTKRQYTFIGGIVLGILVIYFLSTAISDKKLNSVKILLDNEIENQLILVKELASITGRGGGNELTEAVVPKCPIETRQKFDSLLSSLDKGLTKIELTELNSLFNQCGYVFVGQRTVMLSQLQREIEIVEQMVLQRSILGDFDEVAVDISGWKELVSLEKSIRDEFESLVTVQRQIILSLLQTNDLRSKEIIELRDKASNIKGKLIVVTEKASTIRSNLIEA